MYFKFYSFVLQGANILLTDEGDVKLGKLCRSYSWIEFVFPKWYILSSMRFGIYFGIKSGIWTISTCLIVSLAYQLSWNLTQMQKYVWNIHLLFVCTFCSIVHLLDRKHIFKDFDCFWLLNADCEHNVDQKWGVVEPMCPTYD